MVSQIGRFGSEKTLVRDLVQLKENSKEYFVSTSLARISLTGVCAIAVILYAFLCYEDNIKIYVACTFCVLASIINASTRAWFDVNGRLQQHAIITLVERTIFVSSIVVAIYLGNSTALLLFVLIYCFVRIASNLLQWKLIFKDLVPGLRNTRPSIIYLVKKNKWIWLAAIGGMLLIQGNQLLVESRLGVAELAVFMFAFQILQLVGILQNQILRLSTPQIATVAKLTDHKDRLHFYLRITLLSVATSLLILLPTYFLVPYFIDYFLSVDYIQSIPIFNILLIYSLIRGLSLINEQFIIALRLEFTYFGLYIFFGVLSILLSLYLVEYYGGVGVAMAIAICQGGSLCVQSIVTRLYLKRGLRVS